MTLMVRLCDPVAPLVLINKLIRLHIRNSKDELSLKTCQISIVRAIYFSLCFYELLIKNIHFLFNFDGIYHT